MSIIESCQPHPDLLAGTLNPEIFTANLMQVIGHYRGESGVVRNVYTDAPAFFTEATYATDGMRQVLRNSFGRLSGQDATYPAIQRLESAFGGGKTHTLIAATHLAFQGTDLADTVKELIDSTLLLPPGAVTVVGIAGDRVAIHETRGARLVPYTLWGEIAWQIGGEALYQAIGPAATSFGSPADEYFDVVFKGRRVLIMLDELAAYATRVEAARTGGGGTVATFLMSLFQYAKEHVGIAVIVTLAGQRDAFSRQTQLLSELVSQARGEAIAANDSLGIADRAYGEVRKVMARDETAITPVRGAEISRVLARRLFVRIDPRAATATADAYLELYGRTAALLPEPARQAGYRERIISHYPFHPTLIDYLTDKLATVETFQGTRGVLRILALTVANLWRRRVPAPMIHACHLDLRDPRLSDELVSRTSSADLLPIVNVDIGGPDSGDLKAEDSNAARRDRDNPHPEGFPLHEYAWKTVFLHSLAGFGDGLASRVFGLSTAEALLATAFPGLTPPQVETALEALRSHAYYLRYSETEGRYYASTGVSINRVLADIRRTVRGSSAVANLINETSRKVVKPDAGGFEVIPEVAVPERIPDKGTRPTLALVALETARIDPEAFILQAGPNKPRQHQNVVFLLVPETVRTASAQRPGDDMLDNAGTRAIERRERLADIAVEVLARRILKQNPANYGLSESVLSDEAFTRDTREREQALLTVVTQAYRHLWFSGPGGKIAQREISTAGGEGGVAVIESIREVLLKEGKLVTAEQAAQSGTSGAAAKLFFADTKKGQPQDWGTVADVRANFYCRRDWPVLEAPALFETLIRSGVGHGAWCLFRMGADDSDQPTEFHSRDTGELPLQLDLNEPGWSLVTPAGAKQRRWTATDTPDPARIRHWVQEAVQHLGHAAVAEIAETLTQTHGEVAEPEVRKALDELVKTGYLYVYAPTDDPDLDPGVLRGASDCVLNPTKPEDRIVTKAEAARRGWTRSKDETLTLRGEAARQRLLPLLRKLAGLYKTGAASTIDLLEINALQLLTGGRIDLRLHDLKPDDVKSLDELLATTVALTVSGADTEALIVISQPQPNCKLVAELTKDPSPTA